MHMHIRKSGKNITRVNKINHIGFVPIAVFQLMKKTKGRGHGPMDFEVYKGIIDSLEEFPDPVRVIRLYKEGEPLVNPRFADMVRYAKASPKVQRVDTTTNASLLTKNRSLEIIDAGLDRINISVEGINAAQYRDFSGHKMDYQQFVDNIAFFYDHKKQCEMNIKINGDILTSEQEEEFYQTFGNITDGISEKLFHQLLRILAGICLRPACQADLAFSTSAAAA